MLKDKTQKAIIKTIDNQTINVYSFFTDIYENKRFKSARLNKNLLVFCEQSESFAPFLEIAKYEIKKFNA